MARRCDAQIVDLHVRFGRPQAYKISSEVKSISHAHLKWIIIRQVACEALAGYNNGIWAKRLCWVIIYHFTAFELSCREYVVASRLFNMTVQGSENHCWLQRSLVLEISKYSINASKYRVLGTAVVPT
jgi:hypothetical protein